MSILKAGLSDYLQGLQGVGQVHPIVLDEYTLVRPDAILWVEPSINGRLQVNLSATVDPHLRGFYPFGEGFDWRRIRDSHWCLSVSDEAQVAVVCVTAILDDGSLRNWVQVLTPEDMVKGTPSAPAQAERLVNKMSSQSPGHLILNVALNCKGTEVVVRYLDPIGEDVHIRHFTLA